MDKKKIKKNHGRGQRSKPASITKLKVQPIIVTSTTKRGKD